MKQNLSIMHRLRNFATFDKAIAGLVMVGLTATVQDAKEEGRAPLLGAIPAHSFGSGSSIVQIDKANLGIGKAFMGAIANQGQPLRKLSSRQCRQLESQGYLVVDGFLTGQQVHDAREAIQRLDADGQFQMSSNQKYELDELSGKPVRTDRIFMTKLSKLHQRSQIQTTAKEARDYNVEVGTGLRDLQQELGLFARALSESDFSGFAGESEHFRYRRDNLRVPAQMQVTIFDKARSNEGSDDYFTSHLDSAANERVLTLGLLGWLKSKYIRKRYLTCIVYLNSTWQEDDGGCLRLHESKATEGTFESDAYTDIAPLAGRLVVFSSHSKWHAVLPTSATRYACSVWLMMDDDENNSWF